MKIFIKVCPLRQKALAGKAKVRRLDIIGAKRYFVEDEVYEVEESAFIYQKLNSGEVEKVDPPKRIKKRLED